MIETEKKKEDSSFFSKKNNLYAIVVILVIASIVFRLIVNYEFEQTTILFIGLPAMITILIIEYSKTPKTAYGIVFKVITLFLLMCSVFLGEGVVCVLMMAPIFYGTAALIVFIFQFLKNRKKSKLLSIIVLPILLVLAEPYDFNKEPDNQIIESFIIIDKKASIDYFNTQPDFLQNYPNFFKLGFPKPISIKGTGTNIGDNRSVQFKSNTKGIGTLSLEIVDRKKNIIIFKPIEDNTHINHWLTWKQMSVEIIELNPNQTKVKWTSQYKCDLGPSWYFEPLEAFAVGIMNKHLLDAYFNQ